MRTGAKPAAVGVLFGLWLLAGPRSALAQSTIYKTRKAPSSTWSTVLPLTIGSGLEFETDGDQTVWGFPLLIQYNFSETLQMTLEPSFGHIKAKNENGRTVGGLGDFETSLDWEFLHERRWTPAVGLEGSVRWPTASHPELGERNHDYAIGLVMSKDLVFFDVDSNVIYTFAGDPSEQSKLEISIAAEYPLSRWVSLNAELVQTIETGRGRSERPTEVTFGLSWNVNRFWTIEYGTQISSDGHWQELLGWQYSFGGND